MQAAAQTAAAAVMDKARLIRRLLLLLVCAPAMVWAQAAAMPVFSDAEVQRILALGPWPPPQRPDPGNRVSGQPRAIELGRLLFRDPRMSPVGYIACVTCHQPDRAFSDHKARAHGLADLPRNTPALANLRQQRWFGWGGTSDSLWMASIRPMFDAREFDSSPRTVARLFERDPDLAACYRKVFHVSPLRDPQRTVVNVGKALAAYQETLVTGRTPFDDFRDALQRNDLAAAAAYPAAARRGLQLFVGAAGCVACHNGPNFSDGDFHPGPAADGEAAASRVVAGADTGRLEGARSLKASPLNLLGRFNDDLTHANATATRRLVVHEGLRGQYRTPGLRNVAVTGPYLHDGRLDRLQDALQHPSHPPVARPAPAAAPLAARQVDDLAAFLATLTDRYGERRPWKPIGVASTNCD